MREFMVTEIPLIHPDTPARKIFDSMVSGRTRFVLVGRDPENVEGIITRMDLLRYHYEIKPGSNGAYAKDVNPKIYRQCCARDCLREF